MIHVGFYGKKGSFSEEGAILCFPQKRVKFIPCNKSINEVFSKVVGGEVDYGVVPVENSNAGIVNATYDFLLEEKAFVVNEAILPIRQFLMVNDGVKFNDIKRVYSHPVANSQCSKFLEKNRWEIINYLDTASSVAKIKEEKIMDAAAIASKRSAAFYNMKILREDIQNDDNNFTRFFVISNERPDSEKGNKVSIVLGLRNGLNSLYHALGFFIERDIQIVLIQSRPARTILPQQSQPFEYVIYLDFLGSLKDFNIKEVITHLVVNCSFVKFIGSYPKAELKV